MNFVPALAYDLCLKLLAAFTQPGDHLLAEPCTARVLKADVLNLRLGLLLHVKIDRGLSGVKDKFSVSSLVPPPRARHWVLRYYCSTENLYIK